MKNNPRIKCKTHMERIVHHDGMPTSVRWCARCGAIYHAKRRKDRSFTKRRYWQLPSE